MGRVPKRLRVPTLNRPWLRAPCGTSGLRAKMKCRMTWPLLVTQKTMVLQITITKELSMERPRALARLLKKQVVAQLLKKQEMSLRLTPATIQTPGQTIGIVVLTLRIRKMKIYVGGSNNSRRHHRDLPLRCQHYFYSL